MIPIVKQPGGQERGGEEETGKGESDERDRRTLYLLVFPHSSGDHGTRDSGRAKGTPPGFSAQSGSSCSNNC